LFVIVSRKQVLWVDPTGAKPNDKKNGGSSSNAPIHSADQSGEPSFAGEQPSLSSPKFDDEMNDHPADQDNHGERHYNQ
jgi:hypothetical protein